MDDTLGEVDSPRDEALRMWAMAMLVANKGLRNSVDPGDFGVLTPETMDYASALSELKRGNCQYAYLQRILDEQLGVQWDPKDGSPVDAILRRLKLVSRRNEALGILADVTRQAMTNGSNENIEAFLERLRGAWHEGVKR